MNKLDIIHRIVERDFNDEDESFKAMCKTFLESTISKMKSQMKNEDSLKLIGSLSSYFEEVGNEEEEQEDDENDDKEEEASPAILLPKRGRKPNGFNVFLSENGLSSRKGAPIWKSLSADEKKPFQGKEKTSLDASTLPEVPEFWRWQNATQALFVKRHIHVVAICAHEDANRRVVSPMAVYNSYAGHDFFVELSSRTKLDLPERLDRLANQQRSEDDHQICLANHAKRKGKKLETNKKKKYVRPSDNMKRENDVYVRNELRRLIGESLPLEIANRKQVPLAIFNRQGYYIKGLRDFKLENWPLGSVKPLRLCSRNEMQLLRASLENREIKISKLSQSANQPI